MCILQRPLHNYYLNLKQILVYILIKIQLCILRSPLHNYYLNLKQILFLKHLHAACLSQSKRNHYSTRSRRSGVQAKMKTAILFREYR